jgi:group II intron reverse transcriptase/maturase
MQAVHGNVDDRTNFLATLLDRTADTRNLRLAWDYLSREGGQAPGPDGLHYTDLAPHDVWMILRWLSQRIRNGSYHPGTDRTVKIPKAHGGTRTLHLSSVLDRTVQRAVVQIIQTYWDARFSDHSYGFRPGRDRTTALAAARRWTEIQNRWIWVIADIRDAFGSVPQQRLLDVVKRHIPSEAFVQLIQTIVRGTERGLRQGGSLSPLLLNLYLDHVLDRPWHKRHPELPLLRYADDLLIVCRTVKEAEDAGNDLVCLLQTAGLSLKGGGRAVLKDLTSGVDVDWLGFQVGKGENGLQIRISERSWRQLSQLLRAVHSEANAPQRAYNAILDWITQQGPSRYWSDVGNVYSRITSVAQDLAFEEIPSREETTEVWDRAWERWESVEERISCRDCQVCRG